MIAIDRLSLNRGLMTSVINLSADLNGYQSVVDIMVINLQRK